MASIISYAGTEAKSPTQVHGRRYDEPVPGMEPVGGFWVIRERSMAWKAGRAAGVAVRGLKTAWRAAQVGAAGPVVRSVDHQMAEWYANLEVPVGSDLETIKKARRRLLARYHPDLHDRDPERARRAGELTAAINHAYEQLCERLSP